MNDTNKENTEEHKCSESGSSVVRQKIENINVVGCNKENILDHVMACHEVIRRLRLGIDAVASLIEDSEGVCGLHLNGDIQNEI